MNLWKVPRWRRVEFGAEWRNWLLAGAISVSETHFFRQAKRLASPEPISIRGKLRSVVRPFNLFLCL